MSVAGKNVEFGDSGNSFSATFRKALKGFEIRGLGYSKLQFELKGLLASVSRRELRELLSRSESIEPLPEYAYREVRRFLDETIEQDAAPQADPGGVPEHDEELGRAALTAELQRIRETLESERARVREAEEALSESIVAEEAARSRLVITQRESERHQEEMRAARNSIASRDKVIAQNRQTLDERDAQLAAMLREHAELTTVLDLHSASGQQLDADLQVLRDQAADAATELAASREALDKERRNRQEVERALTESNSLNSAARASLASKEKALVEMRQSLDERDGQLAAMRREHAELAADLDSRSTSAEQFSAELQALRAQAAAAALELAASRDAADKERRRRQEIERALTESNSLNGAARESLASRDEALAEMRRTLDERNAQLIALQRESQAALQASEEKWQTAQRRLVGANSDLDRLRAEVASLQARLRVNDALMEELVASVRSESDRAAPWQAAAQQRESKATVTSVRVEAIRQVEVLARAQATQASLALAKFFSAVRSWRWNSLTAPRPIWIGAAVLLLAAVIWFAVHQPSPSAAMVQPATTALATASVETETVPTESVSTIETPPQGAATPAAEKPVTAAAMLSANSRRCGAGDIDACYDAIRYRPSDPSLLSALGDALVRAHRPADALRAYQRAGILAPNMPGIVVKISALEAKLSAKQSSGGGSKQAAPQTQLH
jgi:chromosome segregation ATPase